MPRSMTRFFLATASTAVLAALAPPASAQVEGTVGLYSDATVTGSVVEPRPVEIADDAALAARLTVPEGFEVSVFARGLINPRMLAVSDDGTLYATRRSVGDVVMIRDADGDGRADTVRTVASRDGMHGIAIHGDTVYLATVNDVYTAPLNADGTFGELHRIINDLPDAGQHPNRTLAIGPDGKLYISAGSTCNACAEKNPENATLLRAEPDGTARTIFASGLRNTIGFAWEPNTGALYGADHGIDWLGDAAQQEEINRIEQGRMYGWPYVYDFSNLNPQDNPPEGMTLEQWAALSTEPMLGYTPHSAPMQMAFYTGTAFPAEYRGDAFIAMHGSWNRRPPSGYEVVRVDFRNRQPAGIEPFLGGFLVDQDEEGFGFLGRPTGIAVAPDGALYVADDTNGIVYRVSYAGTAERAEPLPPPPDAMLPPPVSDIAIDLVEADAGVEVAASFEPDAMIPVKHVADGDNASPMLSWSGAPDGAASYVVIMDDPDAAMPKPFVHWIVYDIPGGVTSLREGLPGDPILVDPEGVKQGRNSMGSTGYTGPRPPVGDPPHHYHTQVFALDIPTLGLDPGADRGAVLAAMDGHVLAEGEIVALFER